METSNSQIAVSTAPWFKSYYVVWKRYRVIVLRPTGKGLNRTMQYGNKLSDENEE